MLIFVISFLALGVLVANFVDNALLRDAQKQLLQNKFEAWWKIVENYDKMQLALVCAGKANEFLDVTFGKKVISKRMLFRCSIISASILLITLSWLGLANRQPFGVAPWTSYKESIRSITKTVDDLTAGSNITTFQQINLTTFPPQLNALSNKYIVNINSNLFIFSLTTNSVVNITKVYPLENGALNVSYHRYFRASAEPNVSTNRFGYVTSYTNLFNALCSDMKTFSRQATKFDTRSYRLAYSILYFLTLFVLNAILFTISLAFCRIMLREIAATGRILSTAALLFTNIASVFFLCCVSLLLMTILAIPIFWILVPAMYRVLEESIYTLMAFLLSASFALWIMLGGSAKLIILIAFLPSGFAIIIGLFTLLAITWRNAFHFILKFILIRCAEKSPTLFLVAIFTFISGVLVELAHYLNIMASPTACSPLMPRRTFRISWKQLNVCKKYWMQFPMNNAAIKRK